MQNLDSDTATSRVRRDQAAAEREESEFVFRAAAFAAGQENPREVLELLSDVLLSSVTMDVAAMQARKMHRFCAACGVRSTPDDPLITTPYGWRLYQPRMHPRCYEELRKPLVPAQAPPPGWDPDRVAGEVLARTPRAGIVSMNRMREQLPEDAWPHLKKAFLILRPHLMPTDEWEKSSVPSHRSRKLRVYRRKESG